LRTLKPNLDNKTQKTKKVFVLESHFTSISGLGAPFCQKVKIVVPYWHIVVFWRFFDRVSLNLNGNRERAEANGETWQKCVAEKGKVAKLIVITYDLVFISCVLNKMISAFEHLHLSCIVYEHCS
jgi:hypothetical protein